MGKSPAGSVASPRESDSLPSAPARLPTAGDLPRRDFGRPGIEWLRKRIDCFRLEIDFLPFPGDWRPKTIDFLRLKINWERVEIDCFPERIDWDQPEID